MYFAMYLRFQGHFVIDKYLKMAQLKPFFCSVYFCDTYGIVKILFFVKLASVWRKNVIFGRLFIEIVLINLSKNPYVFLFKMLFEICGWNLKRKY